MNITFQKFLKTAFSGSGLSRQDFAAKIGVSTSTLNNYLAGRTIPGFDEACRIIKATDYFDVHIMFKTPDDEFFDEKPHEK